MDLTIKTRDTNLPLRLRKYAESKVAKLARLFRDVQKLELEVAEERGVHVAELTMEGDGVLLRSQERNGDQHAAIGNAITKLERQALRFKERIREDRRRSAEDETTEEEALEAAEEGFTPVIARRKRYPMKPMSVEEAVRQMELVGHDFFLFRSDETGEISAVYRRHDGDYGLIEPE